MVRLKSLMLKKEHQLHFLLQFQTRRRRRKPQKLQKLLPRKKLRKRKKLPLQKRRKKILLRLLKNRQKTKAAKIKLKNEFIKNSNII
jgi:hypothetical protein